MSGSKKSISFTVESEEIKNALSVIAMEKGYGKVSTMARVALYQMLTRMKIDISDINKLTDREQSTEHNIQGGL